jgi:hypothetical protein
MIKYDLKSTQMPIWLVNQTSVEPIHWRIVLYRLVSNMKIKEEGRTYTYNSIIIKS